MTTKRTQLYSTGNPKIDAAITDPDVEIVPAAQSQPERTKALTPILERTGFHTQAAVWKELAIELERERDQLREQIKRGKNSVRQFVSMAATCRKNQKENERLRAEVAGYKEMAESQFNTAEELRATVAELLAVCKELAGWDGPQYAAGRALSGFQEAARAAIARAEKGSV